MDVLGIFAKYWRPGSVKTRLAATIGAEGAAALSREFLALLLRRMASQAARRYVVGSPPESLSAFEQMAGPDWECVAQVPGDLGRRLAAFFEDAFQRGARRVIVLGSDSPTVPQSAIDRAWEELDRHDVVLGPTADGGYYLVGASRLVPELFQAIPWSTERVWRTTVNRLRACDARHAALPAWYDVDSAPDLMRLQRELADPPWSETTLRRLVDDLVRGMGGRYAQS